MTNGLGCGVVGVIQLAVGGEPFVQAGDDLRCLLGLFLGLLVGSLLVSLFLGLLGFGLLGFRLGLFLRRTELLGQFVVGLLKVFRRLELRVQPLRALSRGFLGRFGSSFSASIWALASASLVGAVFAASASAAAA
ncbi:hypothetical protein Lo5R7ANS_42 [Mesorhizobium phage vB_MloP_Lo5R7ANS]|uniref:Uncharacterized protein n=1 Tax=Mesorhizobium phage vB_MloP_Lo5R7ANS TaxID=1527771 RepID=A0A076YL58_9CAUD|nr:hypothetical protein Lo5R7ANS_42 [Mesorhizobium phage vB_MloP_Lo5R7ANS]AIK68512.1 hypothetical protein Lo5R7ANS_42 [Mesorhizobium phage vB_MloP_Lo5R7ANS]